ncbi:hypothetical protein LPW36_10125 [Jinshanibacter sp. LJY008]|uniref:Uncharacterized protein n=1 Tax=Limnobaculum eriocheiris TaxID=2897391 RepID=A0A9X1SPR9_9GAMM|nr:hypothetical protein [Limnobaculum eriocheiris]MCD1126352.1 hypothetical protein [Limnobaculum eriocheiris]
MAALVYLPEMPESTNPALKSPGEVSPIELVHILHTVSAALELPSA